MKTLKLPTTVVEDDATLTSTKITGDEVATLAEIVHHLQPGDIGRLRLTNTMLNKSIIDANASIRQLAKLFGVDYDELKPGERVKIPAEYASILFNERMELTPGSGSVTFYKTARGDRRISLQNVKKYAGVGDLLGLTYSRNVNGELVIILNISRFDEPLGGK